MHVIPRATIWPNTLHSYAQHSCLLTWLSKEYQISGPSRAVVQRISSKLYKTPNSMASESNNKS